MRLWWAEVNLFDLLASSIDLRVLKGTAKIKEIETLVLDHLLRFKTYWKVLLSSDIYPQHAFAPVYVLLQEHTHTTWGVKHGLELRSLLSPSIESRSSLSRGHQRYWIVQECGVWRPFTVVIVFRWLIFSVAYFPRK